MSRGCKDNINIRATCAGGFLGVRFQTPKGVVREFYELRLSRNDIAISCMVEGRDRSSIAINVAWLCFR